MRFTTLLLPVLLSLVAGKVEGQQVHSENSVANATPIGTYSISDIEHIDIAKGKLGVSVPLMRVGGRGAAGYTMTLPIKWPWHLEHRYFPTLGIWQDHYFPVSSWTNEPPFAAYSPGYMRIIRASDFNNMCENPGGKQGKVLSKMVFVGADGSTMELIDQRTKATPAYFDGCLATPDAMNRGNIWISSNGSGVTFVSDSNYVETPGLADDYDRFPGGGVLLFPDGTRYRIESGRVTYIQDRNGNRVSFTYQVYGPNNYGPLISITDSLNREIVIASNGVISFKGSNGADRTIVVASDTLSNLLATGQTLQSDHDLFSSLGSDAGTGTYQNPSMPAYVQLPDGRRYNIKYNSHADVARIELPTGGAYEYEWSGTSTPPHLDRFMYERREYPDGGSGNSYLAKTKYETENVSPYPRKVTILANTPSGDQAVALSKHYYSNSSQLCTGSWSDDPFNCVDAGDTARESKTELYDASGTTLLQKTETDFEYRESVVVTDARVGWPYNTYTRNADYRPIRVTTTLADVSPALVSKKEFGYDLNVNFTRQTDIFEYDFGSGQAGSFLRRMHTDFLSTNPVQGNTDYLSNSINLKMLPTQKWISSDYAGSNKISLTTFEYDNYSADTVHAGLVARNNVSGFNSTNYGGGNTIRGNVTGATTYANASSQTGAIHAYSQFDILGNVVKTIDGNGNPSTLSYTDNFGAPDDDVVTPSTIASLGGLNTFAYPTSATNVFGWTAYAQYDYYTGEPVNAQDFNVVISKMVYNDPLDRPTQNVTAVGTLLEAQSTILYDDANHRIQTTSDLNRLNDNLLRSEAFYDGLGRTVETRKYEANGGYVAVQAVPLLTVQDPLTNLWRAASKTSNPFRPGAGETPVWTTSLTDELGRSIKVITPDNARVKTDYSGNATTVTDQAGKMRRSITNALGQLIRVDEPNSSGQLGTVASPNQPTTYTYDILNNLLTVTQIGSGTEQCGPAGGNCSQTRTFTYNNLSRLLTATNPESGTISYAYDANGNLTSKVDARSVTTTYAYDALNRVTSRSYSGGSVATPTVSYIYDDLTHAKGKLTKVSSSVSTTEYTAFDVLGRVTASKQTTDGVEYGGGSDPTHWMTYTYNLSGALIEQQYPSGRVVRNDLNNDGTLSAVVSSPRVSTGFMTYAHHFIYNAAGAVTSMQLGNNRWESTVFNSRLQPTQIALGTVQNGYDQLKLQYGYGTTQNNGNVQTQTITVPTVGVSNGFTAVQAYSNDALNRLKDATENVTPSGGSASQSWKQTFSYDRFGNRNFDEANTTTLPQNCTSGGVPVVCAADKKIFDPAINTANNRLSTSDNYAFDNAGNTTVDAQGRTFTYDGENKQTEVKNSSNVTIGQYTYDGDGKRVKKYVPSTGETTVFVYDASGKLVAEYSTIVASSTDAKVSYLTSDHLGSPRINTDRNGAIIARHDYMPFGEEIAGTGGRTTGVGYGDDTIRKQFTGYERDNETDLDFAEARYFNFGFGRFSSPDPIGGAKNSPQSLNRYSYVYNNPLNFVDPSGYCGLTAGSDDKTPCIWLKNSEGKYQSVSQAQYDKSKDSTYKDWTVLTEKERQDTTFNLTSLYGDYNSDTEYQSLANNNALVGLGSNGRFIDQSNAVTVLGEDPDNSTQVVPGSGYWDIGLSGGHYGFGVTGGLIVESQSWNPHLYVGGGLMTPGISGNVNYSPDKVTPGWNIQAQVLPGGAIGLDRKKQTFTEFGAGLPPSASVMLIWIYGKDDGTKPLPPSGPNAAVNSPIDYERARNRSQNCSCNTTVPR